MFDIINISQTCVLVNGKRRRQIVTEDQVRDENMMADRIARKILGSVCPSFPPGNVPVKVAAKVFGKSEIWVRNGIRTGLLPIGVVSAFAQPQYANV